MLIMKILLALIKSRREQPYLTVIDYLCKENQVLRSKFADTGRRLLPNDEQRRDLRLRGVNPLRVCCPKPRQW